MSNAEFLATLLPDGRIRSRPVRYRPGRTAAEAHATADTPSLPARVINVLSLFPSMSVLSLWTDLLREHGRLRLTYAAYEVERNLLPNEDPELAIIDMLRQLRDAAGVAHHECTVRADQQFLMVARWREDMRTHMLDAARYVIDPHR